MNDGVKGVDPDLEKKVLAEAGEPNDRRRWSKELKVVLVMVGVGLVMNGVGLFMIYLTDKWDKERQANLIEDLDCINGERIAALEEGVSSYVGIPADAIIITPCNKEESK